MLTRDKKVTRQEQTTTYFFVEYVVIVGDVISEQVCLRSNDQTVRLGAGRQLAGREATNHLVNVEQVDITLRTQLFSSTF